MTRLSIAILTGLCLNLTACSKVPSECTELWNKIEKLAKQSGAPEDILKGKRKEFEEEISKMPKAEATKSCKTQLAVFELVN
jgi:hypothetical protein